MSRTFTELSNEIVRLGGTDLGRDNLRVVLSHGGPIAGKMRVCITIEWDDPALRAPLRARRMLNLIQERLMDHLGCTIESDGNMGFQLMVEG